MAEERDDLTAANERPNTDTDAAAGHDPEDIERGIRETRAEMSETLDAIGARFRPDYIKEQAKDALRSTARDAGTTMLDTIKENPIPSLIAGLSIGWLIAKGGQSDRDRYDDYDRRLGRAPDYRGYRGYDEPYGRYDSGYYGQGEDGGRSMKDKAADVAGDAKHKVSGLADQAGEQLHEIGDDVQYYGRQATNWLEHQMNANPLAVGAVALAAGALVGLAVPETQKEQELMGHASERVTDKVREITEEKLGQVKAVARETAEDAKEHAKDMARDAQQHAREHDLAEPPKAMGSGSSGSGTSGRATTGTTGGATPGTTGGMSTGATTGTTGGTTSKQGSNR